MLTPDTFWLGRPALVAVSGGSDSVALLHWMVEHFSDEYLHCVTVDHGLRPESSDEAQAVAAMAGHLGLPHKTLTWQPYTPASSADARRARYSLLHQYAIQLDAGVIALGHNLDDQAETVFMRALRSHQDSNTTGLSGIPEWSTFHGVHLWRPLLEQTRQELRDTLKAKSIVWIDDPTNQDLGYERVRVRKLLNQQNGSAPARRQDLARLARLSGRTRKWMNQQVAEALQQYVRIESGGALTFAPSSSLPRPIVLELLACLVLVAGGQNFRSPTAKLTGIADAIEVGQSMQVTLGRCLITNKSGVVTVRRENRNLPELPVQIDRDVLFDGRLLLRRDPDAQTIHKTPYIEALESFRPSLDDPLHSAVMDLLNSLSCST